MNASETRTNLVIYIKNLTQFTMISAYDDTSGSVSTVLLFDMLTSINSVNMLLLQCHI